MSCRCAHLKRLKQAGTSYEETSSVYMDYNAAAPPDRRVLALYQNMALKSWAHPSSPHLAGLDAQELLKRAGEDCQKLMGGGFGRVGFCGGTSSALRRILEDGGRKVLTSVCDHSAVTDQAEDPVLIDVDRQGKMDPAGLARALGAYPDALVVYSPVNHETGAVQDCRRIWETAKDAGAMVFLDGAQSAVRLPRDEWLPYCHGFCLSAQKLYGLKGQGLLMIREDIPLDIKDHAGTPDVPGALATAEALRLYQKEKALLLRQQRLLVREGWDILKNGRFDPVMLSPEDAAAGVLCIALPGLADRGKSMEDLFYHLNLRGICLSRFSACSGSVDGPSPVLEAMGFPGEQCRTSLRISLGRESRREHFFRLRKALDEFAGP